MTYNFMVATVTVLDALPATSAVDLAAYIDGCVHLLLVPEPQQAGQTFVCTYTFLLKHEKLILQIRANSYLR